MTLVLLACLLTSPESCREERLDLGSTSLAACMATAMPVLAEWASERPDVQISRWRCESPERRARR